MLRLVYEEIHLSFCQFVGNNSNRQMGRSIVINLILLEYYVSASNILIWNPAIAQSHVNFLGNIADVLTADGHNVTIFSPAIDPLLTTFGNRLPARTIRYGSKSAKGVQEME
ncbi:hypothetical protein Y032_0072g643 [Ancylostoma ceylanicum]|uniref:Glucuronosyltransferase n=1 Tax=Ancylostoma ceylanicum TaxID=53326 RepID=A0A016TVE6_9BILA|nr:hypothetical protein Y032_0072g643 [Ancylostoma ceylanicum]